jgi:ribonucleoside-diphosphate reductase beta chain
MPMLLTTHNPTQKMPITPIFNPTGDDSVANRTIWFGNTTNLMQLNDGATRLA